MQIEDMMEAIARKNVIGLTKEELVELAVDALFHKLDALYSDLEIIALYNDTFPDE